MITPVHYNDGGNRKNQPDDSSSDHKFTKLAVLTAPDNKDLVKIICSEARALRAQGW